MLAGRSNDDDVPTLYRLESLQTRRVEFDSEPVEFFFGPTEAVLVSAGFFLLQQSLSTAHAGKFHFILVISIINLGNSYCSKVSRQVFTVSI